MKTYVAKATGYEVFGANMTVDTVADTYSMNVVVCQKCQCNCQLCRGGRAPDDETVDVAEAENLLEKLLAA